MTNGRLGCARGAFVASNVFTNIIGPGRFQRVGEWAHVGRPLFPFTVGSWAGEVGPVWTKKVRR